MADESVWPRLASERLVTQLRWAAGLFLVAALLLREARPLERWAMLGAGLALILAVHAMSSVSLARLTLGVVAVLTLLVGCAGALAARAGRPAAGSGVSLGVIASALTAAAVHVARGSTPTKRAVEGLLVLAAAAALLHYFWPWPSAGPAADLAWLLRSSRARAASWNLLSESIVVALSLFPTLVVAFGWAHTRRLARLAREPAPLGALLGLYGTPALLWPLVSRSVAGRKGGFSSLGELAGEVIAAAALLIAVGSSTALAARFSWSKRRVALALSGVALLALPAWALHREDATRRNLGPASPGAERLLSELSELGPDPGSARNLLASAREVSPTLVEPIDALVAAASRDDTSSSAWSARAGEIDAALRGAGLPYYVDPSDIVVTPQGRWFRLDAYRIESAQRFSLRGRVVELLSVRSLGPERRPSTLGLSRDDLPSVLILLDSLVAYEGELRGLTSSAPARCGRADPAIDGALLRCGALLERAAKHGSLSRALLHGVARHELQHQLDGRSPPIAETLRRRSSALGLPVPPRVNRELSAYLAELTASQGAPHVSLARLLRLAVIDAADVDGAAARLALEALAGPQGEEGSRAAGLAFESLASLDEEELRTRAREAWRRELGFELVDPIELPQ